MHRLDLIYMFTLYHQNTSKGKELLSAQASSYTVHSRKITQKVSKGEQPYLSYEENQHRPGLIFMPRKYMYYQNIPKGIKVIKRTSFYQQTDGRTDGRTNARG